MKENPPCHACNGMCEGPTMWFCRDRERYICELCAREMIAADEAVSQEINGRNVMIVTLADYRYMQGTYRRVKAMNHKVERMDDPNVYDAEFVVKDEIIVAGALPDYAVVTIMIGAGK